MPTNLYGPGDNFSPTGSHVLPALIRRYDEARAAGTPSVTNWGTGSPRREFLHVDDLADACLHLLEHYDGSQHLNVGTGEDLTIREIADLVADVVGYAGETEWDTSKPDGMPQKLLDVSALRDAGWSARIGLREGLARPSRGTAITSAPFGTAEPDRSPDADLAGDDSACPASVCADSAGQEPELIIPAPTVTPVASSIRMKEPVVRFLE